MAMMEMQDKIHTLKFKESLGFRTTEQRSKLMRKIRSRATKPEIVLRKALWHAGIRYRVNFGKVPGIPDIVITKSRVAIFVDGEFWHGREWNSKKTKIKSNRDYWIPKIERNIQRDYEINVILESSGWKVMRFWANEVENDLPRCLSDIKLKL